MTLHRPRRDVEPIADLPIRESGQQHRHDLGLARCHTELLELGRQPGVSRLPRRSGSGIAEQIATCSRNTVLAVVAQAGFGLHQPCLRRAPAIPERRLGDEPPEHEERPCIPLSRSAESLLEALPHALGFEAVAGRSGSQRMALLQQAETLLMRDMPVIPLYYYVSRHLVKPRVRGYQDNVRDVHLSRYLDIEAGTE